jgi:hypothetical protein
MSMSFVILSSVVILSEAKNRSRPDRGLSTGTIAIPRCARNDKENYDSSMAR